MLLLILYLIMHTLRCRLSATQKTFQHITAHWWNDLPDDIAVASTFRSVYMIIFYVMMHVATCVCMLYCNVCICMYAPAWRNGF